jgi:phosphoglycerol transferase
MRIFVKNTIAGFLVCIVVALVATYYYGLTNSENWTAPPHYGSGDGAWMLMLMDSGAKGELQPFKPFIKKDLAAPYHANYSDWPTGVSLEEVAGGVVLNVFGLAAGAHLFLILCHVAAGLSMFVCLRFIGCRLPWALVLGVAFGICPFLFNRNFAHISLVNMAYVVPIVCCYAWYLFRKSPEDMTYWNILFLAGLALFMGTEGPYYSAPFLWVLVAASAYWVINLRTAHSFVVNGIFVGSFVSGFLLGNSPTLLHTMQEGKNFEATIRYYGDLQKAALRPIEIFLPGSGSGIPVLKQLSAFYENQCEFRKNFEFCESMASYIGLVGIMGFLLLFGVTVYFILSRQQTKISGWFWFVLFLIAFSVVGGLNGFLGIGKFYFLRSANRYSIYITAICLIYLGLFLSSKPFYQKKWLMWLVATALLLTAIFEPILPRLQGAPYHTPAIAKYESDKKFAMDLEKSLPEGSMVFNYPVIELPERGTYAYFRSTLFTEKIRYSFGALTGRARETWQLDVEKLPLNQMVQKLQEYGFSGILIYHGEDLSVEQKAATNQASEFLNQNQFSSITSPAGDFEFFAFNPNPNPVFPPVRPMFVNNWWSARIQPAGFTNVSEGEESGWRWSTHASAMVEVFNEHPVPRRLNLRGMAIGTRESELQIFIKQKMVFSGKISSDRPVEFSTDPIEVAGHKAVRFELKSDQKPTVREGRKFSFAVSGLETIWE